ncbi:hypothetical protein BH09MYX1_BH09MYX1_57660 [soil metagenome]
MPHRWVPLATLVSTILLFGCGSASPAAPTPSPVVDGGSADASSLDSTPSTDGIEALATEDCAGWKGAAGAHCTTLRISCDAEAARTVTLRAVAPTVTERGTIIFFSGGDGAKYYADGKADALLQRLVNDGFRVVERMWETGGWFPSTHGPAAATCRSAAIGRYVRDHFANGHALCATGNSGGALELGYVLAHHDGDEVLDLAVLTSGPPGRLDHACPGAADWSASCAAIASTQTWACGAPACALGPDLATIIDTSYGTPRCSKPLPGDPAFVSDSLSGGKTNFTHARIELFFGDGDCGPTPLALEWASSITSRGAPAPATVLAQTGHNLFSYPNGSDAIATAMKDHCTRD